MTALPEAIYFVAATSPTIDAVLAIKLNRYYKILNNLIAYLGILGERYAHLDIDIDISNKIRIYSYSTLNLNLILLYFTSFSNKVSAFHYLKAQCVLEDSVILSAENRKFVVNKENKRLMQLVRDRVDREDTWRELEFP